MPTLTARSPHATKPLILVLLLAAAGVSNAQTVFENSTFGYIVDIPAMWEVVDAERADFVSFASPDRAAIFQIVVYAGSEYATSEALAQDITSRLGASGDQADYRYLGLPAVFADQTYATGETEVRGYMLFLNGDEYDFVVMAVAGVEQWEAKHDTLLSALDSFSPTRATRNLPGPVSQFFAEPALAAAAASARETLPPVTLPSGTTIRLPADVGHAEMVDASQVLIEREARVLANYAPEVGTPLEFAEDAPPPWAVAWRRYFRMIYRDNFDRLAPVAEALYLDLSAQGVRFEQLPAAVLAWLQSAEYERTGSPSDLLSPGACLVGFKGDCDSLGIVYAILLHHLGFDAILMVSLEYAHAMVGVDVEGAGARFGYEGRQWLVAELTDEVAIGQIAADMADPAGWVGVKLDPTVAW